MNPFIEFLRKEDDIEEEEEDNDEEEEDDLDMPRNIGKFITPLLIILIRYHESRRPLLKSF